MDSFEEIKDSAALLVDFWTLEDRDHGCLVGLVP